VFTSELRRERALDAAGGAIILNLHGQGGSDRYVVNVAGAGQALVNVHDEGAAGDGVDELTVNGADTPTGNPNDTFLSRRGFVAALNTPVADGFANAERINYDEAIATLFVNGLAGDDTFVSDDNGAVTVIDGGLGDDVIQIGQVFGSPRDANANVAPGDEFATTAVIIGIDDIAYLSSGVTFETTARGGAGNDTFRVYRNVGELTLEGEEGNDVFVVRGFVTLDPTAAQQENTTIDGGLDADTIEYAVNAPVQIEGGAGFDTLLVLGTAFGDVFVVTASGVFGAGRSVSYAGLESITLDALEGDDRIFVLSTAPGVVTSVVGGLGSDVIEIGGDVDPEAVVVTADPTGQDALVGEPSAQNLESIQGPLLVAGGVGDAIDQSLQRPVVLPGELGDTSGAGILPREESDDVDVLTVFHTDNADADEGWLYDRQSTADAPIANPGIALTGLGMGGAATVDGVTYGGGITMRGFEVVEILLGQGDESLAIDATLDGAVTAVHGGGGDDTITITDRGEGPLVVYGDTSEDRARYANTSNGASTSGTAFANDGDDTIDASAMQDQDDAYVGVVIYGGAGDDTMNGSEGDEQLAGGAATETIFGDDGHDLVFGDNHFDEVNNLDPLFI
jgi:Ca2+-binding RTX toxin-like protein